MNATLTPHGGGPERETRGARTRRRLAARKLTIAASAMLAAAALPAAAVAKPPSGGTSGTGSTAYAGRAYALSANMNVLSAAGGGGTNISVGPVSDTGQLPSSGGMIDKSLVALMNPQPLGLDVGILDGSTTGSGNQTVSWANVLGADVNLDNGALRVTADVLQATATATCTNGSAGLSGDSTIANLVISGGGQTIPVSAAAPPNTTITIPNLATIIVNEQYVSGGREVVNALHVKLGGSLSPLATADVIVSHAEAGITCGGSAGCPVKDFVTGGGYITLPSGAKGTFGMVGGQKANGLQGHFNYIDHGTGQHAQGSTLTGYTPTGSTSRQLVYSGDVDGTPQSITANVSDNGEPGGGVDGFAVSWTSPMYSASGPTITEGNIQLHQPTCPTTTKHK
jgi:hypothetical protein